jgi:hypothetical protein
MPEIRIETKEAPSTPATQVAPTEKAKDTRLKVETTPPANSDHHKQIIIYNQGSPVILELGHQRR